MGRNDILRKQYHIDLKQIPIYLQSDPKFKGEDGKYYPTSEAVVQANDDYCARMYQTKETKVDISFKGKDGREYPTSEAVVQANDDYCARMYTKKGTKVDLTPLKRLDDL